MMDPMQQQGGLLAPAMQDAQEAPMDPAAEGVEPAEQDPGFMSATDWVRDKLINGGGAASIAKLVRTAKQGVHMAIGDLAYRVIDEADARANPPMKEENLFALASFVLEEFWEVAAAAMDKQPEELDPAMIFGSLKYIIKKFVSELGPDSPEAQQLSQAMDAITPEQIREMMASMSDGGQAGAEQMPPQPGAEQMQPQGAMR